MNGGWQSRHLSRAVSADAFNAEALAWLGEAQQQAGKDGKAELDKALSLDPHSTLVHALRGLYWKRQGQYASALAEYRQAAVVDPENPEWQVALGDAYSLNGDLVSALASYQKATTLAPNNALYWRLLAMFSADNSVEVLDVGLPAAKKAAGLAPKGSSGLGCTGLVLCASWPSLQRTAGFESDYRARTRFAACTSSSCRDASSNG